MTLFFLEKLSLWVCSWSIDSYGLQLIFFWAYSRLYEQPTSLNKLAVHSKGWLAISNGTIYPQNFEPSTVFIFKKEDLVVALPISLLPNPTIWSCRTTRVEDCNMYLEPCTKFRLVLKCLERLRSDQLAFSLPAQYISHLEYVNKTKKI